MERREFLKGAGSLAGATAVTAVAAPLAAASQVSGLGAHARPDLPCPAGDYVASKPSEAEAAMDLANHLLKAHCKTGRRSGIDQKHLDDVIRAIAELSVKASA